MKAEISTVTENQRIALTALQKGPATFAKLTGLGASGITCVWLVKRGLAEVSMETGEKLWVLTDFGMSVLTTFFG